MATLAKIGIHLDFDDNQAKTERIALGSACQLTNEFLDTKGIREGFNTEDFISRFPGMTYAHILDHVCKEHGLNISPEEKAALVRMEEDRAINALAEGLQACDGALQAITDIQSADLNAVVTIVSSSASRRLRACMLSTGHDKLIPEELVFSAKDSLPSPRSKPLPDIYLHALERTGTIAERSLAQEDSVSGVKSAVSAGITTIGYVGALPEDKRAERVQALFNAGARWVIDDHSVLPLIVSRFVAGSEEALDAVFGRALWGLSQR